MLARSEVVIRNLYLENFVWGKRWEEKNQWKSQWLQAWRCGNFDRGCLCNIADRGAWCSYSGPYLTFVMHKSLQASDDPYSIYSLHCCMSAQNWLLYRSSEVNSVSIKVVVSRQRWYRFGWYAMNTSLCWMNFHCMAFREQGLLKISLRITAFIWRILSLCPALKKRSNQFFSLSQSISIGQLVIGHLVVFRQYVPLCAR